MHVAIGYLVAAGVLALFEGIIILLLMVGISNRFVGFSLAFETIAEDYTRCQGELKGMKLKLEQAEQMAERNEKDLGISHELYKDKMEEVQQLKGQKQYLTREYVKMSNEYAWFRNLVRELDADKCARAEATIRLKKREAPIEEISNVQS